MLQLKKITKKYVTGDLTVDALKGVSLNFRSSEFVAVLGPSGCGKTTMLNIIGGLDKYTDGDLVINGKSTKDFTDRDWDSYRNHSIGFVFQSYNLIPHQTVLGNVELALALSGIGKKERRKRAIEALDKVGLAGQYNKKPAEMSGGQMQRVAIARAIVNNPDIILADEPTGALDSETSVQVMEILKEISKDRLVVMVTHNPDLAAQYATRTVRILDGNLLSDSNPLSDKELAEERKKDQARLDEENSGKKQKKPSLSFGTSFMLSLRNLFTKKGRTFLTSFAGSIGIIGIALIFAVSQGTNNYIAAVQEDTLASYPITIEQNFADVSAMFSNMTGAAHAKDPHDRDAIYEKMVLYDMTNSIANVQQKKNDLGNYKKHLDAELAKLDSKLSQSLSGVHYTYDLDMMVYTKSVDGTILRADTGELVGEMVKSLYGVDITTMGSTNSVLSSMMMNGMQMSMWQELLPSIDGQSRVADIVKSQYEFVDEGGRWPTNYDEIVLVVDKDNEIDDMTLYAMGLKSRAEIEEIIKAAQNGEPVEESTQKKWTFEEIKSLRYKVLFNYELYSKTADGTYENLAEDQTKLAALYDDANSGAELKVVGIVRPNEDSTSHMLTGNVCYTTALTEYVVNKAAKSQLVKDQMAEKNIDILTGLYFKDNNLSDAEKAQNFRDYVNGMSTEDQMTFIVKIKCTPTEAQTAAYVAEKVAQAKASGDLRAELKKLIPSQYQAIINVDNLTDEQVENYYAQFVSMSYAEVYAQQKLEELKPDIVSGALITKFNAEISDDNIALGYYDDFMEFSASTYEDNLAKLGYFDLANPSSISLYAVAFADKEVIEADIAEYNKTVSADRKIEYTDYVGLIMSSVTTIVDAITYVLIAFVSISLIVSSIMIGVITLISVQERTKEIGILRAIGASKANVSGMFNAETVIIGLAAGLLGVLVTYLLCIPINLILHSLTGIATLSASLPIGVAAILVAISMLLTLIAGIIPSRSAAKKDPVVALRSE